MDLPVRAVEVVRVDARPHSQSHRAGEVVTSVRRSTRDQAFEAPLEPLFTDHSLFRNPFLARFLKERVFK
jgi:hypothetical protein